VAIPVLLWTLLPIYHIFLFSISTKDSAFSGALWPDKPTLRNFGTVFRQEHFYLHHFWEQIWNSLWIAVAVGVLTLVVATCAAFAISRLKVKGGRAVMNAALFTYFIPAAFLAHRWRHAAAALPVSLFAADDAVARGDRHLRSPARVERVSLCLFAALA
jgi:multiple sugar transport system permease protein